MNNFRIFFTYRYQMVAVLSLLLASTSWSVTKDDRVQVFDIKSEPAKSDWQTFHKLDAKGRAQLWHYHSTRGKRLRDWAWGWRIGWVRSCAEDRADYCPIILTHAIKDKAMVVRAEAATTLGDMNQSTGDRRIIKLLTTAYQDKRNLRNGKPLFVQGRILYALKKIGGRTAIKTGGRLAGSHAESKRYWEKLNKM